MARISRNAAVLRDQLTDAIDAITAAGNKRKKIGDGYDTMTEVIRAATLLYGPDGAELNSFGVTPEGSPLPPLAKLTNIVVSDGNLPGSILFDWESIEGATYEVQWATDSAFTAIVGSATSTQSEYMIAGLTSGTQYWMRVRPIRGSQNAAWSDPATRVAPL